MSKVSVLVAAYNAESYIHECIDSLLTQTMSDIEVICIDDASTDSTPAILDQYASADSRVVVRHLKENVGQARARNIALAMSDGAYVCMLDSDDWFSPDALQAAADVLDHHPETDSVLFQVDEVYADHVRRYPLPSFESISGTQAFEYSLDWRVHGLYMIRGDLHRRLPYDDSSRAYSDDNTTRMHYLKSREVRQCEGVYHYRQHDSSVTHQVSVARFDYLKANESMLRQMKDAGVSAHLLDEYENIRWLNLIDTYLFYYKYHHQLSPSDREYGMGEMHRIWKSIDTGRLKRGVKMKFGYWPLRPFWWLFRVQEQFYFTLRALVGRN